jgi:hypothetical protein
LVSPMTARDRGAESGLQVTGQMSESRPRAGGETKVETIQALDSNSSKVIAAFCCPKKF